MTTAVMLLIVGGCCFVTGGSVGFFVGAWCASESAKQDKIKEARESMEESGRRIAVAGERSRVADAS